MKAAPAKNIDGTVIWRMAFDAVRGQWQVEDVKERDFPYPAEIVWSMGLPEDKRDCIYPAPTEEKTTQPAEEERKSGT